MTPHAAYRDPAANQIYHLLFCDDASAFAPRSGAPAADWQATLYASPASAQRVQELAQDPATESRVRMLASNWLRGNGQPITGKELFGVIVEVALDNGLDTLAAYADGGVRYLNQSGRMSIFEGPMPALAPHVKQLLEASQAVVAKIGPWDKARLPPPVRGHVRLTFLVSDGLYFGEGPMSVFRRDPMAGPVVAAATTLLQHVAEMSAR
jgi:hypothetical protein